MIKVIINDKDVTDCIISIEWSGDIDTAARVCNVSFYESDCKLGDVLSLFQDKKCLFTGKIMYVDVNTEAVEIEAYDSGVYLSNNYTYREYVGTPGQIASQICGEFSVPIGQIEFGGRTKKITSTGNMTAFKVLSEAFGENYWIGIRDGKFNALPMGGVPVAHISSQITNIKYTSSTKEMINYIVMLDSSGRKCGEREDPVHRDIYGTFSRPSHPRDDLRLKGILYSASLSAIGDVQCIAGESIIVSDDNTGFSGTFVIKSDKHSFTSSLHDMQLSLLLSD